jgi:hypothetical protein
MRPARKVKTALIDFATEIPRRLLDIFNQPVAADLVQAMIDDSDPTAGKVLSRGYF